MTWNNAVLGRTEQRAMKREALLRQAAAAFNSKGFQASSLDDLAASLGVTKAALYYYFPNKQKLLLACFERVMEAGFRSIEKAQVEGKNGREKVHLAIKYYLDEIIDEMSCCVVLTDEHFLLPEDRAVHIEQRDRYEKMLRNMINEGINDKSIASCDPKLVIFTLLGSINWIPKWFSHGGEWSSRQVAVAMSEILDRAISADPKPSLTIAVKDLDVS